MKICLAFSQVLAVTNAEATDLERIFLHYSDCLGENSISVNLLEVDLQSKRSASNTIQTDSSTRKSELSYSLNVVSVNSKTSLSAHTYMFRHAFLKEPNCGIEILHT